MSTNDSDSNRANDAGWLDERVFCVTGPAAALAALEKSNEVRAGWTFA
jgi:hypothetical protein